MITPQQFDANAGTVGEDSTAAMMAAVAACPVGGVIEVPAGTYTINNEIPLIKPISILGEGVGTLFNGTLPNGQNLFHAICPANTTLRGFKFKDFNTAMLGGAAAIINLDTLAPNANMAEIEVSGTTMSCAPNTHGIFVNNIASNLNGGSFDLYFARNVISVGGTAHACINLQNAGDSIHIEGGILTGTGFAIISNQIGGAGNLVVDGAINLTATGGISIYQGRKPIIKDFEMEFHLPLYTGAAINFNGGVGQIFGGTIGPGQMQLLSTSGNLGEAIYLDNTSDVSIDGLELYSEIGGTAIYISPRSHNTRIGFNNAFSGFAATINDTGVGTQYDKS